MAPAEGLRETDPFHLPVLYDLGEIFGWYGLGSAELDAPFSCRGDALPLAVFDIFPF